MKLNGIMFARAFLAAGLLSAALLISGCSSFSDEPQFTDNPVPAPLAGRQGQDNGKGNPEVARFHVGDTITVTLSGLVEEIPPHIESIKEDGTISMPDVGKVQAAGKTAGEVQNAIHDLYVPRFYRHLNVSVTVGDRVYYVRGEVKAPGRQLYVGETTVTRAITSAGDFTDFANHRKVWLIRSNGEKIRVNVNKVLEGKEPDLPVYPGDQVYVERSIW